MFSESLKIHTSNSRPNNAIHYRIEEKINPGTFSVSQSAGRAVAFQGAILVFGEENAPERR